MLKIDLHTHTIASDGQYVPSTLVHMAHIVSMQLLAVTDHDTVAGLEEAEQEAKKIGIAFVPGIEISCQDVEEIHILGYGIDRSNQDLLDACSTWSQARSNRGQVIADYLATLGIEVDLDVVRRYAEGGNLGRPHFARYLVEAGVVESRKAAFDLYLDTDEFKAATDRKKPKPATAIELIHKAGGKAVLAHPGNYRNTDIDDLVKRLVDYGIDGIECFYSRHSEEQVQEYLTLVHRYNLKTSCGSDFHGESVKPDITLGMEFNDKLYGKDLITNFL